MMESLNERLKQYRAAEKAILETGQSYRIGNRTLTRADLGLIQAEIRRLMAAGTTEEEEETASGYRRARRVLFRD